MIISTGIDIIDIRRIKKTIDNASAVNHVCLLPILLIVFLQSGIEIAALKK